jgi:hypothetical protein
MFIACIVYVSYGALPWIPLHSVIAAIGDNRPPARLLLRYNEGLLSHELKYLSRDINPQFKITEIFLKSTNFTDHFI